MNEKTINRIWYIFLIYGNYLTKLNLSLYGDSKVYISIPVEIYDDNLDK